MAKTFILHAIIITLLFIFVTASLRQHSTGRAVDNLDSLESADVAESSQIDASVLDTLLATTPVGTEHVFDSFLNVPMAWEEHIPKLSGDYTLFLNNEPALLPVGLSSTIEALPEDRAVPVVVQFYFLPSTPQRNAFQGVLWDYYLPLNAYLAVLAKAEMRQLVKDPLIRSISALPPHAKYSAALFEATQKHSFNDLIQDADGNYPLTIYYNSLLSLEQTQELFSRYHLKLVSFFSSFSAALVLASGKSFAETLFALVSDPDVIFVEHAYPPWTTTNDGSRAAINVDPLQAQPYNLDGTGIKLLVYDGGIVVPTHPDLAGRVTEGEASVSNANRLHPTHVAATAAGTGVQSGGRIYRGMATNAHIVSYAYETCRIDPQTSRCFYNNPYDLQLNYENAVAAHNVHLATNSLGANIAQNGYPCSWLGDYEISSRLLDGIAFGNIIAAVKNFLVIFSAGNERGPVRCGTAYGTAGVPGSTAKNLLSIGAVYSDDRVVTLFSSWGPTDDGRVKPDVVAAGCQRGGDNGVTSADAGTSYVALCGTSMAAPAVAGTAALLLQAYRDKSWSAAYPFTTSSISGATIKNILIHTAQDLSNLGPDYSYGYGLVDAKAAVDLIREPKGCFVEQQLDAGSAPYETAVNTPLELAQGTLKATLVWNDPPASPLASRTLVNDLDLRIIDPSGREHLPYTLDPAQPGNVAAAGNNNRDNVEQVKVATTAFGAWTVRVLPTAIPQGPQSYSLVVSLDSLLASLPVVYTSGGPAKVGNQEFKIGLRDALSPGLPFYLVIYARQGAIPLVDGRVVPVDIAQPYVLLTGVYNQNGEIIVPVPVPNQPSLAGVTVHAVAITLDPSQAGTPRYIKGISCQKSVTILP